MPSYIINFPTKAHWRGKSKIEYIESGLDALVNQVKQLGLQSVSIPALGSGLGGLEWSQVNRVIENRLSKEPDIEWRIFPPQASPNAKQMVNKTQKPRMTIGRAAVLCLIDRYLNNGLDYELSLLEVQKLVYFLTAAGEPLNQVKFVKHHYGPYADVLRHVLNKMDGHFIRGYGDGQNKPETSIELFSDASEQAKAFVADNKDTLKRFEQVSDLVVGFESPYGMELLSTVHWVVTQELSDRQDDTDAIITAVHQWNKRKAQMTPVHICKALEVLRARGWLDRFAQV